MTHSAGKELGRTTGLCTPTCFRPEGFTIIDATAFVTVAQALTFRAGIFNLLDKTYAWWSDVRGLASTSTVTDRRLYAAGAQRECFALVALLIGISSRM